MTVIPTARPLASTQNDDRTAAPIEGRTPMSPTPAGPRKVLRWFRKRLLPASTPVRSAEALARDEIARGDLARDRRDWAAAAQAYVAALDHQPGAAHIRIQLGHMLKQAGRLDEADAAYRLAAEAAPFDADPWLHRAHVLKELDRNEEAIDAFVEALRRDPAASGARDELISAGARSRLPNAVYGPRRSVEDLAVVGRSLDASLAALRDLAQVSTYPLEAYDAFRRAHPVAPPPLASEVQAPIVVIEAIGASAAALGRTLDSLLDQTVGGWTALVRSDTAMQEHPVASLQSLYPRIVFAGTETGSIRDALAGAPGAGILVAPAGVVLAPTALAWFSAAALRTGAQAVYADHDYHQDHWRLGPLHLEPAFQSMPDADDLATNPRPPVVVLVSKARSEDLVRALSAGLDSAALGRALILAAQAAGGVAHLPRILSSVWLGSSVADGPAPLARPHTAVDDASRILVIVPTRDQSVLLEACVHSLQACADRPHLLDILILDNRSVEPETHDQLAILAAREGIEVRTVDEPFNWARLNTEATRAGTQPLIVFANNDVEAIMPGWDSIVRKELSGPDVGVIGARLLYGDKTLQHGGVVLGVYEGRTLHEGVGAGPLEDGPMGRYRRTRPAAAVTGAFMAVRREVFERLGGFDSRLAIGYNDIDFCLRVRAEGLKVLYVAELTLVHHESRTRGLNDSTDKIAWDDTELKRLFTTWGGALFSDPGVNPHWGSAQGRPMDGYREPTLRQILAWLGQSARPKPWALEAPGASGFDTGSPR
jgi:tetratricopeptide (TPR) repeat protein